MTARLWSNPLSTPIAPFQNRRLREGYAIATLSVNLGAHNLKFGADGVFRSIEEQFAYRVVAYQLLGYRFSIPKRRPLSSSPTGGRTASRAPMFRIKSATIR